MKTTGIILLVLGALSLFGTLVSRSGNSPIGYLLQFGLIIVGIILINKADKKKENENK